MKTLITKLFLFTLVLILSPLVANGNIPVATEQQLRDAIANAPTTAPENETPTTIVITTNIDNIEGAGAAFTVPAGANIALTTNQPQGVLIRRTDGSGRILEITGRFVLNDGITITRASGATTIGGGVQVNNGGTFVMDGGEISGNRVTANGGGVAVLAGGNFQMNDGAIVGNFAGGAAGGVLVQGAFTMTGGTISGNVLGAVLGGGAAGGGGGVQVTGAAGVFTMRGGTITGNNHGISPVGGSAVRVHNAAARFIIDDTVTIVGELSSLDPANMTILADGELTIPANDTLTIQATTLTNNGTIANNGRIVNRNGIEGTGIIQARLTIVSGGEGSTVSGLRTENAPITLEEGVTVGFNFVGWTVNLPDEVTLSPENTFDMPYNAITVTAGWQIMTYTVTFNSQGGSLVPSQTINHGFLASMPNPQPTRLGYTFAGWHADEATTIPWTFTVNPVTSDTTLFARWNIHNQMLTINNLATEGNPTQTGNVQVGTLVELEEGTRIGYDFDGWRVTSGNVTISDTNTFIMPANPVVLVADWITTTYVVTFNTQGGSLIDDTIVNHGTHIVEPSSPTLDFHVFVGWYSDEATTTAWDFDTDVVTSDTTLFARWELVTHVVTFNTQGGTLVSDTNVYHGTHVIEPSSPTLAFHTFMGWYSDEATTIAWDFDTDVVTSDTTLFARWEIFTRTVTFNSRGGSLVNDTVVNHGTHVIEPTPPTLDNYLFGGWYIDEATTIAWHFAINVVIFDTTLFARWNVHTEMLTINNLATAGNPTQSGNVQVGTLITLEEGTRMGYDFIGWTVVSGNVTLSEENTFIMPSNPVTLTANWQESDDPPSNIAEIQLMASLSVYPNPVMDRLHITTDELRIGDIVELFDMNGRRIFAQPICESSIVNRQFTVDMSPFPRGTYILRIGSQTARIVKQ